MNPLQRVQDTFMSKNVWRFVPLELTMGIECASNVFTPVQFVNQPQSVGIVYLPSS